MGRLTGKVAVVTGGAMGIGKASALAMAREGARVVLGDLDRAAGEEAAAEARGQGGEATFCPCDVGVSEDVARLVATALELYEGLDVLFNNAGVAITGSATEISEEDWNRVLNVNLSGVWRGMRYALPVMSRAGAGAIVNNASVQALVGFPGWAGYAATKGAIIALTRQAAVEYAPAGIRVNCVAPGTIMTPLNERVFETAEDPAQLIESWNRMHALGRFGQPEEVAEAVVFLSSEEASFITGSCLCVDGGLTAKGAS